MSVIKIDNLTKSYGDNQVLRGVNREVKSGQIIVIIGASGSGKTTLLRCLNRIEMPTGGDITIDNVSINKISRSETVSGMVFQNFHLFPHLTVERNLTIAPIKINKIDESKAKGKAKKLLNDFGLVDKIDAYPNHLSGGQQQRVAIARELMMDPKILLYDEPTSALDPANVSELEKIIKRLAKTGMTQFIVTHNIEFAVNVADEIWLIEKGRVDKFGTPVEMIKRSKTDPILKGFFEGVD
ncbi:MAG: amino acid ABC transporter ATP-binding protein [Candidatus Nanosyncoccaceae bacterium]